MPPIIPSTGAIEQPFAFCTTEDRHIDRTRILNQVKVATMLCRHDNRGRPTRESSERGSSSALTFQTF
jgi:hypothetical protein